MKKLLILSKQGFSIIFFILYVFASVFKNAVLQQGREWVLELKLKKSVYVYI